MWNSKGSQWYPQGQCRRGRPRRRCRRMVEVEVEIGKPGKDVRATVGKSAIVS
jgi:hypothetical protein